MQAIRTLYAGIDSASFSAVMPRHIYLEIANTYPTEPGKVFEFFYHSPEAGYTIRLKHKSDTERKIQKQGGVSAHVNLHALCCYEQDFSSVAKSFFLEQTNVNRIDFCTDFNKKLPDWDGVKVTRQRAPMVVPRESITYGWGTKYKSLAAIFYDKLLDIQAANGAKDFFLKHYEKRDKRAGVTRFELRIMKEMFKATEKTFSIENLSARAPEFAELAEKAMRRIIVTDPEYLQFKTTYLEQVHNFFSGTAGEIRERPKIEYDTIQLRKQLVGIALAIAKKNDWSRELAENPPDAETLLQMLVGICQESVFNPEVAQKYIAIAEDKTPKFTPEKVTRNTNHLESLLQDAVKHR